MNYMLISMIYKETDCRQVNIHPSHRCIYSMASGARLNSMVPPSI
ncbi:hypothetical protein [Rhizobium laguerreae]|nr:hypothetical protein [Rhizobium laguerreae]